MMLAILTRASLEAAVVAALVWAAIRWVPRLSPATRAALWWCVAAKFLLALVWVTPVELRVLPPAANTPAVMSRPAALPSAAVESTTRVEMSQPAIAQAEDARVNWPAILLVLWAAGLVTVALFDLRRLAKTRGVIRRSIPATDKTLSTAHGLASAMGLRRTPPISISSETATPLVVGVLRPLVLLPAGGAAPLSEDEERMALCHELTHVKRADLWLGLVPAVAERLFFLHPLARLASREYLLCREAACDAAVIDTLAMSPHDYGKLLLTLGVSRQRSSFALAGASSSFLMLKRRIAMLRDSSPSTAGRRVISVAVIALAVAAAVPMRLTARPQAPAGEVQPAAADQAPDWQNLDLSRIWFGPGRAWLSGETHEALLPANEQRQGSRGNVSVGSNKRDLNYVLLLDEHNANMSGSLADIDRARSLRRGSERILWIRRNGVEHVVRDANVIDQVEAIWRPVGELGNAQGELGTQQGVLGTQQGVLGTRQGALGMQQGVLGTKQGEIAERHGVLTAREQVAKTEGERRALDAARRQLDVEMRALDAEMRALDLKMRELNQPMRELDLQMRALDASMSVLDRQMKEASRRAEEQMLELIDRALSTGAAERVSGKDVQEDLERQSSTDSTSSVWTRLNRLERLNRLSRLDRLSRLTRLERLARVFTFS